MSHQKSQGRLKIYFGYAPGVGKTYQMLEHARQLQQSGGDVVIGLLEPHGRSDIREAAAAFEQIPMLLISSRGGAEEMDVDAILRRAPQACVVDELAHSNVPGSPRAKRWEDVQVLLDAGIDVLTTMNVQHLASLSDQIWQITGLRVRESVPDWLFQQADDVVVVDVTPRALLHRLQRGVVYPEGEPGEASGFFQEPTLVALRELAIRQTAQALEARQSAMAPHADSKDERILVNITAHPSTAMLLRRARRVADFLHADCRAVFVHREAEFAQVPAAERQAIERHMQFARNLRIETAVFHGKDRARTLVDYALGHAVTQMFLCRDVQPPRRWFPGLEFTEQVVQLAGDLEVTVVSERSHKGLALSAYPEDEAGSLMHSGYVRLAPNMAVEEAIGQVRSQAGEIEMIFYAYVLDDARHLLGVVSFRELVAAERSRKVRDVMRTDYAYVLEDADKGDAARVLAKRRLLAVPVLDAEQRMRGIISSADVVELVQQEAGKDIQKIGGMEALEGPYLETTFGQMVRKRGGWLAILFVGEMLTATAMAYFEDEIARAVVLALFLPLIISSGGNSGSQATTLVIRAMALGEVGLRDWWRVVHRELATGLALGAILGMIGISRILLWQAMRGVYGAHYVLIAATIGCSLVGVVMFGTIAGSMLPFVLRRCGLDPASASAPFVATLVDVTGLVIYFTVARIILHGSLL
jgi:magnesium transporter